MRKVDVLVAADHDRHVTIGTGLDQHPGIGHHTGLFEAPDQRNVGLDVFGQLAHHHRHRIADRQLGQAHQVGVVTLRVGLIQAEQPQTRDWIAER